MNGAVATLNGGSQTTNPNFTKEELVDFSGKGLKLDTEADGNYFISSRFIYFYLIVIRYFN